jgi:alkylmercury lyase-like protein
MRANRRASGDGLPPRVAGALAAAEIPPSKLGAARRARLTESERDFYFWILRHFATSGRPGRAEALAAAGRLGLDPDAAFETLRREDLVHLGPDGEITVAYPFSGRATAHRVRFPRGNEVDAMCAIDALGIAPMFGEPIEISSRDPLSDAHIRVRLEPEGAGEWHPQTTVVFAGVMDRQDDSFRGCCPVLNFFSSTAMAEDWLAEHPDVRGEVVSMPEAIAAGRAVFGNAVGER